MAVPFHVPVILSLLSAMQHVKWSSLERANYNRPGMENKRLLINTLLEQSSRTIHLCVTLHRVCSLDSEIQSRSEILNYDRSWWFDLDGMTYLPSPGTSEHSPVVSDSSFHECSWPLSSICTRARMHLSRVPLPMSASSRPRPCWNAMTSAVFNPLQHVCSDNVRRMPAPRTFFQLASTSAKELPHPVWTSRGSGAASQVNRGWSGGLDSVLCLVWLHSEPSWEGTPGGLGLAWSDLTWPGFTGQLCIVCMTDKRGFAVAGWGRLVDFFLFILDSFARLRREKSGLVGLVLVWCLSCLTT